jgi:hypothetical protein
LLQKLLAIFVPPLLLSSSTLFASLCSFFSPFARSFQECAGTNLEHSSRARVHLLGQNRTRPRAGTAFFVLQEFAQCQVLAGKIVFSLRRRKERTDGSEQRLQRLLRSTSSGSLVGFKDVPHNGREAQQIVRASAFQCLHQEGASIVDCPVRPPNAR